MTKNGILRMLATLQAMYPRNYENMDKDQKLIMMDTWTSLMSDVTDESAFAALRKLLATCKFPPTIAEMREVVSGIKYNDVPDAGDAWQEVNRAISHYGYYREADAFDSMRELTRQAAARMGWKQLCTSEVENDMADRAHFMKIYNAISKKIEQDRLLPDSLRDTLCTLAEKYTMASDRINLTLIEGKA